MMKKLAVILVLAVLLSASQAFSATQVVVIPLGAAEQYMYWQGAWTGGAQYKKGDSVSYSGSSYVCLEGHMASLQNVPPSAKWSALAMVGAQGAQGPKGDKGDPGLMGAVGLKGDKGDTGAQGPQGPQGPKGDTGLQGLQGVQGPVGDAGPAGEKGDKGDSGASRSYTSGLLSVTSLSHCTQVDRNDIHCENKDVLNVAIAENDHVKIVGNAVETIEQLGVPTSIMRAVELVISKEVNM